MEVALVYNMKKDTSDVADGGIEPSSQNITDVSTQIVEKATSADTYAEWDTIETVTAVRDALSLRHSVTMIEADEDAYEKLRSRRPEIVFNIAEGQYGVSREAQIPAMLEMLNIPYSGSELSPSLFVWTNQERRKFSPTIPFLPQNFPLFIPLPTFQN